MNELIYRGVFWTLAAAAAVGITLLADCCSSPARWEHAVVTDKIYEPQTAHISTDSSGITTTTLYGPFYYIVTKCKRAHGRVCVTAWEYDNWQRGDECMVKFVDGRLMTYGFLSILEAQPE